MNVQSQKNNKYLFKKLFLPNLYRKITLPSIFSKISENKYLAVPDVKKYIEKRETLYSINYEYNHEKAKNEHLFKSRNFSTIIESQTNFSKNNKVRNIVVSPSYGKLGNDPSSLKSNKRNSSFRTNRKFNVINLGEPKLNSLNYYKYKQIISNSANNLSSLNNEIIRIRHRSNPKEGIIKNNNIRFNLNGQNISIKQISISADRKTFDKERYPRTNTNKDNINSTRETKKLKHLLSVSNIKTESIKYKKYKFENLKNPIIDDRKKITILHNDSRIVLNKIKITKISNFNKSCSESSKSYKNNYLETISIHNNALYDKKNINKDIEKTDTYYKPKKNIKSNSICFNNSKSKYIIPEEVFFNKTLLVKSTNKTNSCKNEFIKTNYAKSNFFD